MSQKVDLDFGTYSKSQLHTLIAGIPSLGTSCVCQKPTPAVNDIASSVVRFSTSFATSALAICDGDIENFRGAGSLKTQASGKVCNRNKFRWCRQARSRRSTTQKQERTCYDH